MGMFDQFVNNLSNPAVTVGSTLLKSAQEGRAIVADKKRKEAEAEAEYEVFLKKEDVKIEKQLEKERRSREDAAKYKRNNFAIDAELNGMAEAIKNNQVFQAENLKNIQVGWSEDPVSRVDIQQRNENIKELLPKVLALGNFTYKRGDANISLDNQAGLSTALNNGDINLAQLYSKVREADIQLEKDKKLNPTYEQKQKMDASLARVGGIKTDFPGAGIEEAKRIITHMDQGHTVIDIKPATLEDPVNEKAINDFNSKNIQKIDGDNSYLVLPDINSNEYVSAKDHQRKSLLESYVLNYSKIPQGIFAAINKDDPAQAGGMQEKLAIMMRELWALSGGMKSNKEGGNAINTDFTYDWKGLYGGTSLSELPEWYKETLTETMNLVIPVELQEQVNVVFDEITNPENNKKDIIMSVMPTTIIQDDINSVYPPQVYQGMDRPPISKDDYTIYSIVAHSNATGKPLYTYGLQTKNDKLVLGDTFTKTQTKNIREAVSVMRAGRRINHYGAKLFTPLFYSLQNGGILRDVKVRQEKYDEANFEFLNLASTVDETKPKMGMPVSFDPEELTKRYISSIAAGIRKDQYGGYLLPNFSGLDKGISVMGAPRTLLKNISIKTAAQYAKMRELNLDSIRDQAGQSERALESAYGLYKSLGDTQIGSGLIENIILLGKGIGSIAGLFNQDEVSKFEGYKGDIKNGNYNTDLDDSLANAISKMGLEDNMKKMLLGSLENSFTGDDQKQNIGGFFSNIGNLGKAEKIAQQQMLHASLVFYAAAAFQGEGGKAISDADRDFVAWALNYGAFSSPEARKASILGMIGIMAKSNAINNGLLSSDVSVMWAADNYNSVVGNFVDDANRGLALSPQSYPKEIREKHNLDSMINKRGIVSTNVGSASAYENIPLPNYKNQSREKEGVTYKINDKSITYTTDPKSKDYEADRKKAIAQLKFHRNQPNMKIIEEDVVKKLMELYKPTEEELSQ